jgi:hypothetical protein
METFNFKKLTYAEVKEVVSNGSVVQGNLDEIRDIIN